jgi:uncharacterized small protein (DUF1192 family)
MPASEDDDRPKKKIVHEIGQDLALLSIRELEERIALLERGNQPTCGRDRKQARLAQRSGSVLQEVGQAVEAIGVSRCRSRNALTGGGAIGMDGELMQRLRPC